jgi:aminopeptidase N
MCVLSRFSSEFVHMVELLITTPVFNRGLDHYHTRFKYSNATTNDWIESMEHASGKKLMAMADGWLRRSGHPHVLYSGAYDAASKSYKLTMEQTKLPAADPTPWILPVDWSLVKDGKVLREGIFELNKVKDDLVIPNIDVEPDFLSFARGWSFFGTHANTSASAAGLARQALTDPDVVNRYFSYRAVTDGEKAKVILALQAANASKGAPVEGSAAEKEPAATGDLAISAEWVQLHATILFDERITAGARASILREGEDIHTRPDLSFLYWEISDARLALLQAVYDAHAPRILALYQELQNRNVPGPHLPQLAERSLKHHLFLLLAAGQKGSILASRKPSEVKVDIAALAKELLGSSFMTDQLFAFSQYLSGSSNRLEKLACTLEVRERFKQHPDSIETFVGVLAGLDSPEATGMIRELLEDKEMFNVNQAGSVNRQE